MRMNTMAVAIKSTLDNNKDPCLFRSGLLIYSFLYCFLCFFTGRFMQVTCIQYPFLPQRPCCGILNIFFHHQCGDRGGPGSAHPCIFYNNSYGYFGMIFWGKTDKNSMILPMWVFSGSCLAANGKTGNLTQVSRTMLHYLLHSVNDIIVIGRINGYIFLGPVQHFVFFF